MLYLLTALVGLANAVQTGANSSLGKALDNKFAAALCILAGSISTILVAGLLSGRLGLPAMDKVAGAPWWAWTGGTLAAAFVLAQLFMAEQVGAAVFMTIVVTAAVTMSLVMDHYGLLGFKEHAAGWGRIVGAGLMFAGLALIAKF